MYTSKKHEIKNLKEINEEFEEFLNSLDSQEYNKEKIRDAFKFSKKAHIYQKRTTGEPYIAHPLAVSKIVHELGLDTESIVSALLHDVVEDTEINLNQIKEEFGEEVEKIVDGLTKITDFGRKKEEVQIEALRKVLLASAKDPRILIIKLSDRLHNMRTLDDLAEEKRRRVAKETLLIYAPIAQKIGLYNVKWELEDRSFKQIDFEMFEYIRKKVRLQREEREVIVSKAVEEIKTLLNSKGINNVIVLGRPKNFYSIYKKIKDKARDFEEIFDLYAIRIITPSMPECYTVLGTLHESFQAFPDKLKDYIANPKLNGYQSIHTVIYSRSIKNPVEVQIRDEEMHKLAEFGIAAHWRYKNLREDKKFERKIGWLREVMQWENEHKETEDFMKLLKLDFFEDEIFLFTPKNDVIVLPEGSSVLDFAYAVHTEIGSKATKGKVNGVSTTIDKPLKSGDIVEIITNKNTKPNEKWLKIVKTNKARLKIRQQINLKHSGKQNLEIKEVFFDKIKSKLTNIDAYKKVRKAKCCDIKPTSQVVGLIGKNKELVVHNASCDNAKYTIHEKVQLRWKEDKRKEISISLMLKDRIGLLIDILNVFSKLNINLLSVNSKVHKNGDTTMTLELLDGPYVEKLEKALRRVDSVESVKVSRGLFW